MKNVSHFLAQRRMEEKIVLQWREKLKHWRTWAQFEMYVKFPYEMKWRMWEFNEFPYNLKYLFTNLQLGNFLSLFNSRHHLALCDLRNKRINSVEIKYFPFFFGGQNEKNFHVHSANFSNPLIFKRFFFFEIFTQFLKILQNVFLPALKYFSSRFTMEGKVL